MEQKYKIKEHLTEQFNMRVTASSKAKESRARGLGYDVPAEMRKYYEKLVDELIKDGGQDDIPTLIPAKENRSL